MTSLSLFPRPLALSAYSAVLDWLHWCGQFREGHKRREGRI